MDKFDPAQFIKIAADDISKLRKCDVWRVLTECNPSNVTDLTIYIKENRPDLINECDDCWDEMD